LIEKNEKWLWKKWWMYIDSLTIEKTGEVISKNDAHSKGVWHNLIHILLVNKEKNKILLQKRCADKKLYLNRWDITVGDI